MIKLQISRFWPGGVQRKYIIMAKGYILAILQWGNDEDSGLKRPVDELIKKAVAMIAIIIRLLGIYLLMINLLPLSAEAGVS